jgi:hypothetical protein
MTDHPAARLTEEGNRKWGEYIQEDSERGDRRQDTSRSKERRGLASDRPSDADAPETGAGDGEAALREQIRELETELERSEHRVQSVINHYERLLAQKNRRLHDETEPEEATTGSRFSLSAVLWWRAD